MMEARLTREIEKSKSALYKFPIASSSSLSLNPSISSVPSRAGDSRRAPPLDDAAAIESQLSPEQLQLFADENADMLSHYQASLDQVRTAERSLLEISELQSTLGDNLSVQAAHIDQLVADASVTEGNVGGGNKQLKKAAERRSTARMVFWGVCAFAGVMIGWDLII